MRLFRCSIFLIVTHLKRFLEKQVYASSSSTVLFLRPAMSFLLMHSPAPKELLISALPRTLTTAKIIFIPINNNLDVQDAGGGSHWSLLVYYRPANHFYYYDSIRGSGSERLAKAAVDRGNLGSIIASSSSTKSFFMPIESPVQTNGFDCGVYLCAITEILAQRTISNLIPPSSPTRGSSSNNNYNNSSVFLTGKPGDLSDWKLAWTLKPQDISKKRQELNDLIDKLCAVIA